MTVADLMVQQVVKIHPDALLYDAVLEMNKHHVRHLPVVEGEDWLVGIITNRDIRILATALPEEDVENGRYSLSLNSRVGEVMTECPIVTEPHVVIEEILDVFLEEKVGAIPVVEEHKLVGIIGYIDLLTVLRDKL